MKQNTHRLVDLAKKLQSQGSGYDAARDSVYTVEPLTVQVVELPAPLKQANVGAYPNNVIVGDTNIVTIAQVAVGVLAAATQAFSNQILDAGLWHIIGNATFQWLVGATTVVNGMSCGLQDPDGFTYPFTRAVKLPTTGTLVVPVNFTVSLDRNTAGAVNPGWRFVTTLEPQLAADSSSIRLDLLCNRLI